MPDPAPDIRVGEAQGTGNPSAEPTANPNATPAGNANTMMPADPTGNPNMSNPNMPADPNSKCADTWSNYAQAFFKGQCVGCHATYTEYATVKAEATAQQRITSGDMPRGTPLSAADKARILNWYDCKQPQ